jgi:arabinosyltransferase C
VLAAAALVAAAGAAIGPATHLRTTYSWPPRNLPAGEPQRLWYTPLLLARHEPESISARIPCSLPRALSKQPVVTVLATARNPVRATGLAITRRGGRLVVQVGDHILAAARLGGTCSYELVVTQGRWALSGGPDSGSRGGDLAAMPIVDGLFTGLDLRSGTSPSVDVTTRVYGSRGTTLQKILWSVAAFAALVALLLVAVPGRPRRFWARAARGVAHARPVDAVVGLLLICWWVVGPSFFDDGWRLASQKNYATFGGFSTYYSSFGVAATLDWLQWTEHVLLRGSVSLLALRLPALLCLAATWILSRWILNRMLPEVADRAIAAWALAAGFAVGALAWGMTFRPEPVVALLVTGVLTCTILFVERETAGPLVAAAILVLLAVLAHPAGIVALAPLLAVAPTVGRWARLHAAAATTIVLGTIALLGVLAIVGSDLQQRRADVVSLRTYGDEISGWRDEITRYSLLGRAPYGSPLRREWVALAFLAILAYLLRRRPDRQGALLGLPSASLGIALLLLIATPSKLPWHFGGLIGIAALGLAAETARLRRDARGAQGWQLRPFLVIGAAMLAAAWSWSPRNAWADLDLRTLQWTLGIEKRLTLAKVAGVAPLALLFLFAAIYALRRRSRLHDAPWRAAAWTVPVVAAPLVAFIVGVLIADAAKTHSWTLARQNVQSLKGDLRCGLADDALVPVRASMRALSPLNTAQFAAASWLPPAPVEGLPRFALGPPPASSPWFRLPHGKRVGFFLAGIPGSADSLELEWGRAHNGKVEQLAAAGVSVPTDDARPDLSYWRFYSAANLPSAPAGATAVRFAVRSANGPGAALGLTAPVTYDDESLARLLVGDGPSLALPNLLTYVPCVTQPRVGGVADVPKLVLAFRDTMWPLGTGTSPFDELPELYRFVRLSLSDSQNPPGNVAVYEVDRRIEGAAIAPPVVSGT